MLSRLALLITLLLAVTGNGYCQASFCPPNLDFEQGNLGSWHFDTGSCCPINITNATPPLFNRHMLMSGPGLDSFGLFPVVAPGGGNFSLKLGNYMGGKESERARYYIQVPPGPNKYIFVYKYAIVMQNPALHTQAEQPRFQVKAFDSITGNPLACNQHTYVSSSNLPGFQLSTKAPDVYFKSWTSASLDLSAYAGKTVAIDFASGDCDLGGHFGYGYVDMNCGLFQIFATSCNNSPDVILKGPPGYQAYKWMDANFLQQYGTTQDIKIPSPPASTFFAVIVTPYPGFGCVDTFYTEYNVKYEYISATAADVKYCANGSAQLSVTTANPNGPFLYNWWPSFGLSCTGCSNPLANPGAKTTYYVSIENTFGCRDTATVEVDVLPVPQAYAGADTAVCPGSVMTLNGTGGIKSKWTPAFNLNDPNIASPTLKVVHSQIYKYIATNAEGCHDTDEIKIELHPEPVAYAGEDTSLCYGAIVELHGSGADTFLWYPDKGLTNAHIPNPLAILGDPIDYYLKVTNRYGCSDTDVISFYTFFPEPFKAGPDTSICRADTITLYAIGGQEYHWLSDYAISGTTGETTTVWPGSSYKYVVSIKDSLCNRADTLEVSVKTHPGGQMRVVPTPIKCGGESIGQLTAYGGKGYQWIPVDYLSHPNSGITKANPKVSTLYTVVAINGYGCPDTASALLEVHGDDGIFAPDAFTPNGDGKNDCFKLIVTGDIRSFEWHIYNRWGQPIFESNNYNDCWDGKYKGDPLDLGTYYYFFKASSPLCGDILRKGEVQLIR